MTSALVIMSKPENGNAIPNQPTSEELEEGKYRVMTNWITKMYVRLRESKGQTMTEYVLIIAAIAVAGYVAYQGLEGGINTIITNVTNTLKGA
jgi:Flp pilus assembly pilin Flp